MTEVTLKYKALYSIYDKCWDSCYGHRDGSSCYKVATYPVSRVTAKRIYFVVRRHLEENEHFVDRAAIERDGAVWHRGSLGFMATRLHLSPPNLPHLQYVKSVEQLRREMADCHPDIGGDPAEFRAAHARYTAAKAVTR